MTVSEFQTYSQKDRLESMLGQLAEAHSFMVHGLRENILSLRDEREQLVISLNKLTDENASLADRLQRLEKILELDKKAIACEQDKSAMFKRQLEASEGLRDDVERRLEFNFGVVHSLERRLEEYREAFRKRDRISKKRKAMKKKREAVTS